MLKERKALNFDIWREDDKVTLQAWDTPPKWLFPQKCRKMKYNYIVF